MQLRSFRWSCSSDNSEYIKAVYATIFWASLLFLKFFLLATFSPLSYIWYFSSFCYSEKCRMLMISHGRIPPPLKHAVSYNLSLYYEFHYFSTVLTSSALSWVFVPWDKKKKIEFVKVNFSSKLHSYNLIDCLFIQVSVRFPREFHKLCHFNETYHI